MTAFILFNGVTTFSVGNYFEVTNGATTKYYYFGAQRIAMRTSSGITYLHGDHLGSTSVTSGANSSTQTYYAFGAVRTTSNNLPTDFGFTGQKIDASDGLMYYGARYYDAAIGRFIQPDTIIPNLYDPQLLNRFAYVRNNPVRYTDPTGHRVCEDDDCRVTYTLSQVKKMDEEAKQQEPSAPAETKDQGNNEPAPIRAAEQFLPGSSYWSLSPLGLGYIKYGSFGFDMVIDWEKGDLGFFGWTANGVGSPQVGTTVYKGFIWGLNDVESYKGRALNAQASVGVVGAEYFEDKGSGYDSQPAFRAVGTGLSIGPVPATGSVSYNDTRMVGNTIHLGHDTLRNIATAIFLIPGGQTLVHPFELGAAWLK